MIEVIALAFVAAPELLPVVVFVLAVPLALVLATVEWAADELRRWREARRCA